MDGSKRLLTTGIVGTAIAALCCFTPVLVVLAGVLGLSAVVGYLDYILLPALAFFLGLTIFALHRYRLEQHTNNHATHARSNQQ